MQADVHVRYRDNHVLVVEKPPGLLSQADRTGDVDVLTLVKKHLGEPEGARRNPFVGLVHRLDRPASGLMVLALTSEAAAQLSEQFRERMVDKRYLALVQGRTDGAGIAQDYLKKEGRDVRVVPQGTAGAQRASLQWRSLAVVDELSLVEIQLDTGRSHQIRVQMAHRGHPVLGDFRYGADRELDGRNLALHAFRLAFRHPARPERMRWTSTPPDSWPRVFEENVCEAVRKAEQLP